MATYNGGKYIEEQLKSILPQIGPEDEIIISDDGSTDNTLEIVHALNDSRIKVFHNEERGLIKNFENSLNKSNGEFIFLSDQDDIWKPGKIEITLKFFREGYDLVMSDCEMFDSETRKIVNPSFFKFNNSKKGVFNNILSNSYIGCCMAFNHKVKQKALPFPKSLPMHDSWIGILAELFFRVKFFNQPLISYRIHSKNASFTGKGQSNYTLKKKIGFRFMLCENLVRKIILK